MSGGETAEALVLRSADGQYFAIPRAVVEAHAVTDAQQRAFLDQLAGGEVQGYAIAPSVGEITLGAPPSPFFQPGSATTLFSAGAGGFAFLTTSDTNPFVMAPIQLAPPS